MAQETERGDGALFGIVKWFDPSKGFGFVKAGDDHADILLHANVLRNFGQSSIAEGTGVTVLTQQTERGVQAVEILSVEPPTFENAEALPDIDGLSPEHISELPMLAARIKWFDKAKGFGFANVFGQSEDIFIHIEVLRRSGFSELVPGEAIALRETTGNRGRMAVMVAAWETAQKDD